MNTFKKLFWRFYYTLKKDNAGNTIGMGKSAIMVKYARLNGLKVEKLKLSSLSTENFSGVPTWNK